MGQLVLGIETSCDETAAAVVSGGRVVASNVIASQAGLHRRYGGVVPELASRRHLESILPVVDRALHEAGTGLAALDGIAVTYGPGLAGALLVGVSVAKSLCLATGCPLIGVNHLEGHLYANFLGSGPEPSFPAVCLVVSGGHTDLVYVEDHGRLILEGMTRDDAAGEVFDKLARAMGLGYPGGPLIDALSREGDAYAVPLPRSYLEPGTFDFSFSGLKTACLLHLEKGGRTRQELADLAASFQRAVADVLVTRTVALCRAREVRRVLVAGGVAANTLLRSELARAGAAGGWELFIPSLEYCTDNAAMIASCGAYARRRGVSHGLHLNAMANLPLGRSGCDE
ncbi:MAG TPA: tRNA (adenosine(37)-N6)-threonylcarbamoyltransferase complex transferase subunit TsaD [Clostridiales bacterium UBA8153]|nr:tRNA (adenosine(37)-N6)-threonylcarbamoyltransferase complex transferase subunit TsaD [Clostridiales bacterium UBA8153]